VAIGSQGWQSQQYANLGLRAADELDNSSYGAGIITNRRRYAPLQHSGAVFVERNYLDFCPSCPSSNALGQSAVFGTEALARLG
jgi:hypothetical protein